MQQQQLFTQSQFSALGEMASGIAHEINNPLTIISASAALVSKSLQNGDMDKEFVSEIMGEVDHTVKRISKIIQGLRNISRDPSKDEFELSLFPEILEDVISLCSQKFKGKGIKFEVETPDELEKLPIELLKIQISQVLVNLLNNAYDGVLLTEDPEKWINLKIKYHKISDQIEITVTDSGPGIPEEIIDKVFNPFFTTKDIGKGTGLGLSLSNAIIKRHRGEFYINRESSNTQFVIKVPRLQSAQGQDIIAETNQEDAS